MNENGKKIAKSINNEEKENMTQRQIWPKNVTKTLMNADLWKYCP